MIGGMRVVYSPRVFAVLSLCFFFIGFVSVVGVIAHWQFDSTVEWLFVAYATMNILLGVGFWLRERWLLIAVALNCLAYSVLYIGWWASGGDVNVSRIAMSVAIAGGVWWLVHLNRRHLIGPSRSIVGTAFFLIWILTYSYTFTNII